MRKKFIIIVLLFVISIFFSSCEDYTKLTAPVINSGSVDFSSFVAIGNTLTAGYQSGSLFESAQKYSFGKQIANLMNVSFEQPIISDPGTVGRLEVKSLSPFTLYTNPNAGAPKNLNYPKPYNNLGIPGALYGFG